MVPLTVSGLEPQKDLLFIAGEDSRLTIVWVEDGCCLERVNGSESRQDSQKFRDLANIENVMEN